MLFRPASHYTCVDTLNSFCSGTPDLWNGDALEGIYKEHAGYEIPCSRRQVAWQVVDASLDLLEQVGYVLIIKRQAATKQRVQDDTAAPHVNFRTSIQLT